MVGGGGALRRGAWVTAAAPGAVTRPRDAVRGEVPSAAEAHLRLEDQLSALARAGVDLAPGVTIDDLLYSFDRDAYESRPFHLLLFMFGAEVEREPWGRPISLRAWNFDTECVHGPGSHARVVQRLVALADAGDRVTDVRDDGDTLSYVIDGRACSWPLEVHDDWADTLTLSYVMADLEHGGRRFYARDNGQAMVLYWLDAAVAAELDALSGGALRPVTGGP